MSGLPRLVQRAPSLFYGAAILYFVGSIVLTRFQLAGAYAGGVDPAMNSYVTAALLSAALQAAEGALYLVANGVIAHILLAIWRDGRERADRGNVE